MKTRSNYGFYGVAGLVALMLIISILSPYLVPYNPYDTNSQLILSAPSAAHWFGTDAHGRDIFSRVLVGSRLSLFTAFAVIVMAGCLGTLIGLVGGYVGGKTDAVLMRITDIFLAFPDFLLAIAVAGILGGGLSNAIIALLATTWTQYARLARGSTIALKNETFVKAAKLSGCSHLRILFVHILPNCIGTLLVTATLHVSTMIMGVAGLSFLGIGIKIPEAEWGSMISAGRDCLQTAPWVALIPSLILVCVMIVFNIFGDMIRDKFDPRMGVRD